MKLDHSKYLPKELLFWGNINLKQFITDEQQKILCDMEFFDWLSSLYWGEGIAMNYALKMSEISPDSEKWLSVYKEEHRHQTLLSNWFIENGMSPKPKSKFIDYAFKLVDRLSKEMESNQIINTIYATQVLYEELFHFLLKTRTKEISNRDLKAIFYQIYKDESAHLTNARVEIRRRGETPRKLYETVEKNAKKIFPLDIAKSVLSLKQLQEVELIRKNIVLELISDAKNNSKIYSPIPILESFQKIPGYNCVACSPTRADGLHLEPKLTGVKNEVYDQIIFPKRCEGFNHVVHGGFIAMALDEIMVYASILNLGLLAVTSELKVSYKKPVRILESYKLEAVITSENNQIIHAKASIRDGETILASAEATLFVPTEAQATKILGELGKHEVVTELCFS